VAEFRGTAIKAVKGATVMEDGDHVMLGLETAKGEEMLILMPTEAVSSLILLAAQCSNEIDRKKGENAVTALNVTRWKLTKDNASDHDVLLLTVGGRADLAFRLPTRDAQEALDVLSNPVTDENAGGVDPSKLN
jgi:hypothetical protein